MDSISDSDSEDAGSIPAGVTKREILELCKLTLTEFFIFREWIFEKKKLLY